MDPMIEASHLDHDIVAAYLDGELGDEERISVESHLAECDVCCQEVVALDETLRTTPRARSIRRYATPALAAAAVLAAVLVARPWAERPPTPGVSDVIERAAPDVASTRMEAVSPGQGAVVEPDNIGLQWRSAGEGARYQITVATTEGDSVWVAMGTDTVATVPAEALVRGIEYLWYVDALLPDGRTASTGVNHFQTGP
jgi:predicted anti-sigma-YlaC factor YlaD